MTKLSKRKFRVTSVWLMLKMVQFNREIIMIALMDMKHQICLQDLRLLLKTFIERYRKWHVENQSM